MAKVTKAEIAALKEIQASGRATADVGKPLADKGLIEVNTSDVVDGKALARLTAEGEKAIAEKPKKNEVQTEAGGSFALITGIQLPEAKRGFGRKETESKYPFKTMEVGASFFVSDTEAGGSALKKLGSTVSNANAKFRTPTGQMQQVTRTKRDGSKTKETVEVPVYKQDKKFAIRGVTKGTAYGAWTAPENGAIIQRTE